jgi:hypothetical protein
MGRYRIWCPDLGQEESDAQACTAFDSREAAEEWAEWSDRTSAEYTIAGGTERNVLVRDLDNGEASEWTLTGESVPTYIARFERYRNLRKSEPNPTEGK